MNTLTTPTSILLPDSLGVQNVVLGPYPSEGSLHSPETKGVIADNSFLSTKAAALETFSDLQRCRGVRLSDSACLMC